MIDFKKFSAQTNRAVGLGEVLFDIYDTGPRLGGAPANFVYHCKNAGIESLVISAVGKDDLGEIARNEMAAHMLPALLNPVDFVTGAVIVKLDENKVPTYTFKANTAYDHISLTKLMLDLAPSITVACYGTLAQRNQESHQAILGFLDAMTAEHKLRIFDVNLRCNFYSKEIILETLKRSEALKCNEDELPILSEMLTGNKNLNAKEFYLELKKRGIDFFIFTEGANQSTVFLNDEISVVPTPKVCVVDTVGAGDSFTGSLVAFLIKGLPLPEAHKKATELSAYVCTQKGAMPDMSKYFSKISYL